MGLKMPHNGPKGKAITPYFFLLFTYQSNSKNIFAKIAEKILNSS